jgi:hypothetical protein
VGLRHFDCKMPAMGMDQQQSKIYFSHKPQLL